LKNRNFKRKSYS